MSTFADRIASSTPDDVIENIDTFLLGNSNPKEVTECYNKWAASYDSDVSKVGEEYTKPKVAEVLSRLCPAQEKGRYRILDVACGTGQVGAYLRKLGFDNMDGIDGSPGMLKKARENGIYRNYYHEYIGDHPLRSVSPGSYDALLTTGSFCPNHLSPSCLSHIAAAVKSGGLVVIGIREEFTRNHEDLRNFPGEVRRLEEAGIWEIIQVTLVKDYYGDIPGLIYVMKIK